MKVKLDSDYIHSYYLSEGYGEVVDISEKEYEAYLEFKKQEEFWWYFLRDLEEKYKKQRLLESTKQGVPSKGFD